MRIALLGFGYVGKVFSQLSPWKVDVFSLPKHDVTTMNYKILEEYDVVVNFLPSKLNSTAINVAARAGVNYVDFSHHSSTKPEQKEYDRMFYENGTVGLSGMGIAPGLDNMLIGYFSSLGGRNFRIYLVEHQFQCCGLSWSPTDFYQTAHDPPLVLRDGRLVAVRPFGGKEEKTVPFGPFSFYYVYGDEISSLAYTHSYLHIELKAGGSEIEFMKKVISEGISQHELANLPPAKNGVFGIAIEGDNRGIIYFPTAEEIQKKVPGATHISYPTAWMGMLAINYLDKLEPGVLLPQEIPAEILREMIKEVEREALVFYVPDL